MECKHKNLKLEEPNFTALVVEPNSGFPEYITYTPYICQDCKKRVIVLTAIVEEIK